MKAQKPKYTIEYRRFKDTSFFSGWFANMKPEWSEWQKYDQYYELEQAKRAHMVLETRKPYLKYRVEYRMIKNE